MNKTESSGGRFQKAVFCLDLFAARAALLLNTDRPRYPELKAIHSEATRLSNELAQLVLAYGSLDTKYNFPRYSLKLSFAEFEIRLSVSNFNGVPLHLFNVIANRNQNDKLSVAVTRKSGEDSRVFSVSAEWSMPKARLDWLRAVPEKAELAPALHPSEWYTYFPDINTVYPEPTTASAHERYVQFIRLVLSAVQAKVSGSQPDLSEFNPSLFFDKQ